MTIDEQLAQIREQLKLIAEKLSGHGRRRACTLREAADDLRVGLSTVKQLVREQVLLTVTIGRRRLVPAAELDRLLTLKPSPREMKTRRKTEAEKIRAALRR